MRPRKDIGYYQGILQLRNPNKEVTDFVKSIVEKEKGVDIAHIEKVVNGFDYYLSSQRFLQTIGRKLKKQFAGELKTSRKLFTLNRITMKRVYRLNVLFRLPKVKKGDIVKYKGREIRIKALAKKISAVDIENGKKFSLRYGDI